MAKASVRKQPAKAVVVRKQPAKAAVVRKQPAKAGAAPDSEPQLTAAVLGGSIAGLMASLVLDHNNFKVDLYERQLGYTRSIQWTVRQSFIDYLYSVDRDIAEHLFTNRKLVSGITNGYRYMSDKTLRFPDGAYLYKRRDGLRIEYDERAKPNESCAASLAADFVGIIRAKELETHLREQIQNRTNVQVHLEEAPECVLLDDGRYALKKGSEGEHTPYDLIVGCVGAGWSRESSFPMIKFNPVSRVRPQVSGEVDLPRQGMVTAYQHLKKDMDKKYLPYLPSGEFLYSTLLSTDKEKTNCWVIGDVSTEFLNIVAKAKDDEEKNKLAKEECGKIAARTLLETDKRLLDAKIKGAVDDTVKMFPSQAKISSAACAGDNLVLAGDAVGAGHWAVGGGMHVAGMCHQKRLEALATVFLATTDRRKRQPALKKYSDGALEDTRAWISKSMEFYYLSIPKDVVNAVYNDVIEALKKNDRINGPDEMRKRIISAYFGPPMDPEAAGFTDTL
jgi:2-polyprenyl-6-methoxyphenol hydroxylase-like FAD-dependent oxidoreductase